MANYQGKDFLDWYKYYYNTDYDKNQGLSRKEGMADVDWNNGNILLNNYLQKDNLLNQKNTAIGLLQQNYQTSSDMLDTNKSNAQQSASITLDKLKKYLPTQIRAQGLGGLGVSESSMLQAYNNYNSSMGQIESNHNENKTNLNNSLNQAISDLETAYGSNVVNLDTKTNEDTNALWSKYADDLVVKKENNYSDLASLIKGNTLNENIQEFFTQIDSADIDENQKALLKTLATNQVADNKASRQSSNVEEYKQIIDNFTETYTDKLFSNIDALDISDEQKQQLKNLAQSKVDGNTDSYKSKMRDEGLTDFDSYRYEEDWENAKKSLDHYKKYLSTDEYDTRMGIVNDKIAEVEKGKAEKEKTATDTKILEGKQYVQYNGSNYQIKSQLGTDANEIRRNNSFTKQLNALGYSNPYDSKIPNGTTFEIKVSATGTDEFNAGDILAPLFSPLGLGGLTTWSIYKKTVTYYNGSWYVSEKK